MRRFATPAIIICLVLIGIGGFLIGRAGVFYHGFEKPRIARVNPGLKPNAGTPQVVLFFLKSAPANFYLKPILYRVKDNKERHVQALEALFAGPPNHSGLLPIFPKDTKVLNFNLKNGIATVNLNQNATRINVGSSLEALAVASIVNTLTKFPDVFRVKILVEGKEVESLAGHVDLTGLLRYNDQVVDPELL